MTVGLTAELSYYVPAFTYATISSRRTLASSSLYGYAGLLKRGGNESIVPFYRNGGGGNGGGVRCHTTCTGCVACQRTCTITCTDGTRSSYTSSCCAVDEVCIAGSCCPAGQACFSQCCAAGSYCSEGRCCPVGSFTCGRGGPGRVCCPPGQCVMMGDATATASVVGPETSAATTYALTHRPMRLIAERADIVAEAEIGRVPPALVHVHRQTRYAIVFAQTRQVTGQTVGHAGRLARPARNASAVNVPACSRFQLSARILTEQSTAPILAMI